MRRIIALIGSLVLLGAMPHAQSAGLSEGSKCKKLNAITKSGSQNYICLKSGSALVQVAKFKKCAEVISAGRAPIVREMDSLLYLANAGLDRDKDGTACDQ